MNDFVNDLTPEIIEMYTPTAPSKLFKVYFHPQTKDIQVISKSPRPEFETFIEVDASKIENFLTGVDNFNDFRVVLNASNKFEIVSKVISKDLKATALIEITQGKSAASLNVVNELVNKQWKIQLAQEEQERLSNSIIRYTLEIFVTGQTKNNLHRALTVDLNKLVADGEVVIPHKYDVESLPNNIRLLTIKFFESYVLRNDYESKV